MKKKKRSHTVYFGGELFSLKHLIGNAYFAEAVFDKSHGRYRCVLPQNFALRRATAHVLRDECLRALLACDLGLFHFDGAELDSGTLVEFMVAKFADIPAIILRSDFRAGGDQRRDPWNLMCSFFPRTLNVIVDGLPPYKKLVRRGKKIDDVMLLAGQHSSAAAQATCESVAAVVVRALDRVLTQEPVMPKHLREEVYNWLALMPGFRGKQKELRREFEKILERKVEWNLL